MAEGRDLIAVPSADEPERGEAQPVDPAGVAPAERAIPRWRVVVRKYRRSGEIGILTALGAGSLAAALLLGPERLWLERGLLALAAIGIPR